VHDRLELGHRAGLDGPGAAEPEGEPVGEPVADDVERDRETGEQVQERAADERTDADEQRCQAGDQQPGAGVSRERVGVMFIEFRAPSWCVKAPDGRWLEDRVLRGLSRP
jgi:hypothetical protein